MRFWDLLLKRYAGPFPFLDRLILNGMLPDFIDRMMEEEDEEKLWQLYLSRALFIEESFAEWKEKVKQGSKEAAGNEPVEEADVEAAVKNAEGILMKIKPV